MTSRPSYLRDSPRFDRSHWSQEWTRAWRPQVADFFCGHGGVGRALDKWFPRRMYFGVDYQDYGAEYPGQFVQADLLDGTPPFDGVVADLIWVSFPCTGYSSLTATNYPRDEYDDPREAALADNPRLTDSLREWCLDHAAHYVIENVPRATEYGDLDANCRANGLFFGEAFDYERHFETTFECPDAYVAGDADVTIDTREDQSVRPLAEAKGVPAEWGKQAVRSAIPWQYVWWVLSHCPSVPCPAPKHEQYTLASQFGGIGAYRQQPDGRMGGTDVEPGDELYGGDESASEAQQAVVTDGGQE